MEVNFKNQISNLKNIIQKNMKQLSKIADNLLGQPMFGLLSRAKEMERAGRKIIHFEIGDPIFNSPSHVINAAKTALDNNLTHYTGSMGIIELREAVADYIELNYGFKPSLGQVLICPANAVIDFVSRCVVNPGEEIIYPDPGFPTYYSVINYNGMTPVPIQVKEENSFRMNPGDVAKKITDKTRLIIINTPQNPTGAVMTKEEVAGMANISKERDIYLLSDEVYSKIIFGKSHYSASAEDQCKERTIILGSLSKIYSMSGWRLGYAVGPEKVIQKMGLLLETIISCLPPFVQLGGRAALLGDQNFLTERIKILKERRDLLIQGLNNIPGISCVLPEGAFYAFPNIKNTGLNADEYSEKLLRETGVCLLPGTCFGEFGKDHIRLCYASADLKMIEETLNKIKEFHKKL